MSLRNRARSLQKKTGLSYQQALGRLRALGERPATLARQTGWPLDVCDRYLVDGHAPIEVVGPAPDDLIQQVCESFRATSNARVVLVARDGHVLACAGEQSSAATAALAFLSLPAATHATGHEPPDAWEMESGDAIHQARVKRALLVVRFHRDETSLGLIRLRARRAIEQLERLLDDDEAPEMPPIGGQGGGPSGVPNELRVVEPVPAERPKPRPKPIGRKKRGG